MAASRSEAERHHVRRAGRVDVTIVTPIAPVHASLFAARALPSIERQTVPAQALFAVDVDGHGPAAIRNRLLAQVDTPFVVFLDADDWLAPDFLAQTLAVWRPGRYVYTDWFEDDTPKAAPAQPWCSPRAWHIVTALLPTEAARAAGGFLEDLPGAEDTAFYWSLVRGGHACPHHLPRPLVHYSGDGVRSRAFVRSATFSAVVARIWAQFGGRMGCCGHEAVAMPTAPTGAPQPGDVLAMPLWSGNRQVRGRVTGRLYPRGARGRPMWVALVDVQAAPQWWTLQTSAASEALDDIAFKLWGVQPPTPPPAVPPLTTRAPAAAARLRQETHA